MITVFNRATLFVDSNSEAAANVWSALKANGIKYEMRTKQNVSTLRKAIQFRASTGSTSGYGGMSASHFMDTPNYVYTIYVKKRDLAKAKEICHLL